VVDSRITRRSAFTLAEVLLALALVTIVLLSVVGLALNAMSAMSKSVDVSAGLNVAEQEIERLAYDAENAPTAAFWTFSNQVNTYSTGQVVVGASRFSTATYVTDVADSGGNFVVAGKRLKQVKAVVVWSDAGADGKKAGKGTLRATAARLVHEP
jgi:type II secretory pathway pseudopilin PulG